jgi:CDP-diacylglycerol---glycerol-3-phosphate 3-phosphatidyltransferase
VSSSSASNTSNKRSRRRGEPRGRRAAANAPIAVPTLLSLHRVATDQGPHETRHVPPPSAAEGLAMTVTTRPLPLRREALALWTVPNLLTLVRIAIVPVLVYLLRDPGKLAGALAAALVFVASLTDYFDGYLARKHGIVTTFGKFLDPLADKLIVVSVLIMLAAMPCLGEPGAGPCVPRVPAWVVVLIVGRELAVPGQRRNASGEGIKLGAEELGKYKMIFQMFALVGLLLHYRYFFIDFHAGGMYFLWISLVLGLWSAADYHLRVYRQVRARRDVDSLSTRP